MIMKSMLIKTILTLDGDGRDVTVEGWIRTKRVSKGITFLEVNDGSTIKNLQVVLDESFPGYEDILKKINTGCSVIITGKLIASEGMGQAVEVKAASVDVVGESPENFVLQKKRHSFEFLRDIAHLRPRTNTFGAVARIRSAMSFAIHKYFQERDFVYVHTPIITGSDCEGAGEMFQVTTLPLEKISGAGDIDYGADFFGKKASLTVSGQLEGETYACALKNIYTFGPTFRAENSNTSRHLSEFWMVEPEMAFCDLRLNMAVAEEFIKYIFSHVLEHCADDMEFFDAHIGKGVIDNLRAIISSDFGHVTYSDAVEELKKSNAKFEFPVSWGSDLQSEHEKFLTEEVFKKPIIVTDYPREIKAFYMKLNGDGKTVRAMDVLVPRLGEIIGGSERESDHDKLEKRIIESGLDPRDYWWYLELRKFGSVPHSGFGLGFERLIQFVTGMQNIRDVIPFPRAPKLCEF